MSTAGNGAADGSQSSVEDWTFNDFLVFLSDAIIFDIEANKIPERRSEPATRLARTSFINAALAVEAAANACLARLPYPQVVIGQLDRPQPMEKYNILYQLRVGTKLDTSHQLIKSTTEILELRNTYVHAKLRKEKVVIAQTAPGIYSLERMAPHLKPTPHLHLPRNPNDWTGQDSRVVVKTVLEFLNYFFIDLSGLTTEEANQLLCSVIDEGHSAGFVGSSDNKACAQVKAVYGIDIKFVIINLESGDGMDSNTLGE